MNREYSLPAAVIGLVFMVLGVVFTLDAVDAINLRVEVILPVALMALGLAVIISAIRRHADEPVEG